MNKRFIAVLVFAFVVASGASLLLYRLMSKTQPAATAAQSTVKIVVATRNLEVGTLIKEGDIKLADWPGSVPVGARSDRKDVIGRGVISPIYDKEPILESRLGREGAGGGLAATIPVGLRAVAVRVNDVVGVAGFVVPGMRVDVLISGNGPGNRNNDAGTISKTLLQNLEVLSAGQDFKRDGEGKPVSVQVVNLLVTPEQAEQLTLASSQTSIQLVLRNPTDHKELKTPGAALSSLFSGTKPPKTGDDLPPVRAPRPRPVMRAALPPQAPVQAAPRQEQFVMEIIQGTKRNETKFNGPSEAKQ